MKNLGVDIIYVITRTEDYVRIQNLEKELSFIKDLNLKIIPAVTGESLTSIPDLIDNKTLFPVFTDPAGLLTKNIIATALSHKRAVQTFYDSDYDNCLILEDDAKVSKHFWQDYCNGSFTKFIEETKSSDYDVVFWGRETYKYDSTIKYRKPITDSLYETWLNTNEYGAHAYQVSRKGAEKILNQISPIRFAADVFLESCDLIRYSPEYCYFYQDRGYLSDYHRNQIKLHVNTLGVSNRASSTRIDLYENYMTIDDLRHRRNVRECKIYQDIPIEKITFKSRKLPNGDVVDNWASIHFLRN